MSALAEVRFATAAGGSQAGQRAAEVLTALLDLLEVDPKCDRAPTERRLLASVAELGRSGTAALAAWLVQGELAVQVDTERAPRLRLLAADDLSPELRRQLQPWQGWWAS